MDNMDTGNFKKISSDEMSTVLEHPDGHRVTLQHKFIRPEIKKQLDKLPVHAADGLEVEKMDPESPADPVQVAQAPTAPVGGEDQGQVPHVPAPAIARVNPREQEYNALVNGMRGKPVSRNIMGLGVGTTSPDSPDYESQLHGSAMDQLKARDAVQQAEMQAQDALKNKQAAEAQGQAQDYQRMGIPVPSHIALTAAAGAPQGSGQNPQDQNSNIQLAPKAKAPENPDPFGYGQLQRSTKESFGEQTSGIMNEAKAEAESANKQANLLNAQAQEQQKINESARQHVESIHSEIDKVTKELANGTINPNQYMQDLPTEKRVMTTIGLLLGGLGAGLSKDGRNLAAEQLDKNIQNNIESQKANINNKHSLLNAYRQQLGDEESAVKMFGATNAAYYSTLIQQEASRSKNPIILARAQQAIGQLMAPYAANMNDVGRKMAVFGPGSESISPAMKIQNAPGLKDDNLKRAAFEELKSLDELNAVRKDAFTAFDEAKKEVGVGGALNPQSYRRISAAMDSVILTLARSLAGKVSNEEIKQMESLKPAQGDTAKTLAFKEARLDQITRSHFVPNILKGNNISVPIYEHARSYAPEVNTNYSVMGRSPQAQQPIKTASYGNSSSK